MHNLSNYIDFTLCDCSSDITAYQQWVILSDVMSYRDLSFPHDAVCAVSILFVLLGLVVTFLVAEQPQGLRALQLNLKLLRGGKKVVRSIIL